MSNLESKHHAAADVVDVAGADALLHVDQALPQRVPLPQQERHERLHPCRDEQRRRVILRQQRRGGQPGVAAFLKEALVFVS